MRTRSKSAQRAALALALAVSFLASSGEAALARCVVERFNFTFGQQVSTTMTADSGVPCNMKMWEGFGTKITSIATVTAPGKGAVRSPDPLNVAYRSRSGYRGTDKFVIAIVGTKFGEPKTARVLVTVTVSPPPSGAVASRAWPSAARQASQTSKQSQASRSARQRPAAPPPSGLRAKCLQQVGAGIDPVTKRWMFYVSEGDAMSRIDMLRMCLAGGDRAKANRIPVPEIWQTHPGDRGPTQR